MLNCSFPFFFFYKFNLSGTLMILFGLEFIFRDRSITLSLFGRLKFVLKSRSFYKFLESMKVLRGSSELSLFSSITVRSGIVV